MIFFEEFFHTENTKGQRTLRGKKRIYVRGLLTDKNL